MRLMARAAARASLPLKHSQGFNPRPRLALVPPRPVGVASRCELMVIQLTEPIDAETLCRKLNEQLPRGISASAARPLPSKRCPRVRRIRCEVSLDQTESTRAAERIDELDCMSEWTVQRHATPGKRGRAVDLKGSVEDLAVQGRTLRFALAGGAGAPPRSLDVLTLLHLTGPAGGDRPAATEVLARTERIDIEYNLAPDGPQEGTPIA